MAKSRNVTLQKVYLVGSEQDDLIFMAFGAKQLNL